MRMPSIWSNVVRELAWEGVGQFASEHCGLIAACRVQMSLGSLLMKCQAPLTAC